MLVTYADIAVSDLPKVAHCINQKQAFRTNIAGDRVIIKWNGPADCCITELDITQRNKEEMLLYLNKIENGWIVEGRDWGTA
jgi:hypothetical protein